MIIDKELIISIGSSNNKYYTNLGYICKNGDKLKIDSQHLQNGCNIRIDVKCDICGKENNIIAFKYFKNINRSKLNIYTCIICSDIKRKITNNINYGVNNVSQSNIIKDKKIKTTLENWKVENPSQSIEIKEKKTKTMLKNYGVEYVFQSETLRNNIKKTCLEKYNDENYNNRTDSVQTCLKKYGCENISQNEDIKQIKIKTCLKNWGVENQLQNEIIKENIKKTNLKKYGCEYAIQNNEIFTKASITAYRFHKYEDSDLYYQGTYELDFLKKYYNKIKITKFKNKILYNMFGKNKYYHPDFYLPNFNLIVEIKSDYTYKKELEKNLVKQKSCIEQGYKFIFIINKNYDFFDKSFLYNVT